MPRTPTAHKSFRPGVEALEDRLVLSVRATALISNLTNTLQGEVTRLVALQSKLSSDISKMRSDVVIPSGMTNAGKAATFDSENATSPAPAQATLDQDYAAIAADVGQINALGKDVAAGAGAATILLNQARRGESRGTRRLVSRALTTVNSLNTQATMILTQVTSGQGVATSPVAGIPSAPTSGSGDATATTLYPALGSIPGFLG